LLGVAYDAGDGRFGDHHQTCPLGHVPRFTVEGVQDRGASGTRW